jgi:hypothetical protein
MLVVMVGIILVFGGVVAVVFVSFVGEKNG